MSFSCRAYQLNIQPHRRKIFDNTDLKNQTKQPNKQTGFDFYIVLKKTWV